MNWQVAPLGEVCKIIAGGTPKRSEPTFWGGDIPWVKISDMLQGKITETEESITAAGLDGSAAKLLPTGTVLVSIFATIGRTALLATQAATNQAIVGVVPKKPETFDLRFLQYMLAGKTAELQRKARGVAQANINGSVLKATEIVIPPLPEQERIAAILDAADALRAKRRESIEQLDALIQSTFIDMFGDPVTNPMGWKVRPLLSLARKFCDGPFGSNLKSSHYTDSGIRVIRLQNIGVGEMINDDVAYISNEHYQSLPRNHCQPNDVIIGTLGEPNLRACIVPETLKDSLNKADCLLFRADTEAVRPTYVCWLLNSPQLVKKALELVRGQTRGRISLGRLKEIEIPVPPLEVQQMFQERIEAIRSMSRSMKVHDNDLDALFASLQSRAFAGGL